MKQDFVIYGNKLISLFIGAQLATNRYGKEGVSHPSYTRMEYFNKFKDNIEIDTYSFEELKYHSNYSWLMSIVEIINSSKTECFVTIFHERCRIHNMYPHKMNDIEVEIYQPIYLENGDVVEASNTCETIFIAIVKFLEWYNTQNI